MTSRRLRSVFAALVATMLLVGAAAPAIAATTFNANADAAQDPYIATDVTVSSFDRADMNPGDYEDNNGNIATLPATLNESTDPDDDHGAANAYSFVATDLAFSDAAAFPHDKTDVSAVHNESEWSTDVSGSAGSMTVSDVETAPGVEALEVSTSSQTSDDVAIATFSNVSVTSDVEKRYLQAMLDVTTLDSGTTVQLRAVDSDGDYVEATINSSAMPSNEDVIGNATGEGYVYQRQVGSMTVAGSGDGTMSEVSSIKVRVVDGDATVRFSGLNAEKTGEYTLGDMRVDSDEDDGDYETETITEVSEPGAVSISDLSTMGPAFDSAVIHGLTMPMNFRAQDLDNTESTVSVEFMEATSYPSFEFKQEVYYRLELPSAYDLSYANAKLKQKTGVPNSRYQTVELSEGVSDTSFDEIDSWTGVVDSIGTVDSTSTLDDTIQPGQKIAVHEVVLVTADERENVMSSGAVGQFTDGGGGGLFDMIMSPFGALAAVVGGLLARLRGAI